MKKALFSIGTYQIHNDLYPILAESWKQGIHLLDTAPNYRNGQAHDEIRRCLDRALLEGIISSEKQIHISTKVGFIPSLEKEKLCQEGIIQEQDTYHSHNISEKYIQYQMERSIDSLEGATLDVVYLHNPEVQLHLRNHNDVLQQVRKSFECFEQLVQDKKFKSYGIATWSAFEREDVPSSFTLKDFISAAEDVSGRNHNFRAIQLPISMVRLTPLIEAESGSGPLCEALQENIEVHVSSPLFGGELPKIISKELSNLILSDASPGQAALLFAKSHPAVRRILTSPSSIPQLRDTLRVKDSQELESDKIYKICAYLR